MKAVEEELNREAEALNQYVAKAMLLGMMYDPRDHTFNVLNGDGRVALQYDADTMQGLEVTLPTYRRRVEGVIAGTIGPDWLRTYTLMEREMLWSRMLK